MHLFAQLLIAFSLHRYICIFSIAFPIWVNSSPLFNNFFETSSVKAPDAKTSKCAYSGFVDIDFLIDFVSNNVIIMLITMLPIEIMLSYF